MLAPFISRRTLYGAGCVALAIGLVPLSSTAEAGNPLDAYLPKSGKIEGHIVQLGVAPEDQAIDRQFRAAVQKNMEWFKKYVTGQKSGGALPYDPRMGVSKEQYERLQHMHADVHEVAPFEATVARGADGSISFATKDPAAASLDKVKFPADGKVAETPYGPLGIFNPIHQTDARAPLGVWAGAEWAQVEPEDAPEPSAKIAFGKRDPSGEGVMYYQVARYKDHPEQSLVVVYKLD